MSPLVQTHLALILFLPWFLILAVLFWVYPRQPRGPARRLFDAASLVVAFVIFVLGVQWAHANADRGYGHMWQQVFATSVGYGLFLAAMLAAFVLRRRWIRGRRSRPG